MKTSAKVRKKIRSNVYLLWHTDRHDDDKLIGVYTKKSLAAEALKRAKRTPGFSQKGGVFEIASYDLDKDYWTSGFHGVDGHSLPAWFRPNADVTKATKSSARK